MSERATSPLEQAVGWAYRACYFLLRDKSASINVVCQALGGARLVAAGQKKKESMKPQKEVRQKVSLDEAQIIQYLTYLYAEQYERIQEAEHCNGDRRLTDEDFIIRYIKHLILIYMQRNSFHAAVGQGSVLFDFSTGQVIRLYETLVQGSWRRLETKGDYSVRDTKRVIKKSLAKRFGQFISTFEGPRREVRFRLRESAGDRFGLVRKCLHKMRPLIYVGGHPDSFHLPAGFDPIDYDIESLQFDGADVDPQAEQLAEMRRMHAVIHPCCFARLLRALGYGYSREHLSLPSFNLTDGGERNGMSGNDSDQPPELTRADMELIAASLERSGKRRSKSFALRLMVVVDFAQRYNWDLAQENTFRLNVDADTRIIEIMAQSGDGDLPLAIHLLAYEPNRQNAGPCVISLEGGQEFLFTITNPASADEAEVIDVSIAYRNKRIIRAVTLHLARFLRMAGMGQIGRALSPAVTVTAIAVITSVLFLVGAWYFTGSGEREVTPIVAHRQDEPQETSPAPDERQDAKESNANMNKESRERPRKPVDAAGRPGPVSRPRSFDPGRKPLRLTDLRTVSMGAVAGDPTGNINLRIVDELKNNSFSVVEDRMRADSVLNGKLIRAGNRLTLRLWLVNFYGETLWEAHATAIEDGQKDAASELAAQLLRKLSLDRASQKR